MPARQAALFLVFLQVLGGLGLSSAIRQAQDKVLVCRFTGEIVKSDLLETATEAIPLDVVDVRFVIVVRVREIQEGKLPEPWKDQVVFAVHSPSRFFAQNGIAPSEGSDHPSGMYLFNLWRLPDGKRALDIRHAGK